MDSNLWLQDCMALDLSVAWGCRGHAHQDPGRWCSKHRSSTCMRPCACGMHVLRRHCLQCNVVMFLGVCRIRAEAQLAAPAKKISVKRSLLRKQAAAAAAAAGSDTAAGATADQRPDAYPGAAASTGSGPAAAARPRFLSLGLSPFSQMDNSGFNSCDLTTKAFEGIFKHGDAFYPFKSLAAAKAKYGAGVRSGRAEDPGVQYSQAYFCHRRPGKGAREFDSGHHRRLCDYAAVQFGGAAASSPRLLFVCCPPCIHATCGTCAECQTQGVSCMAAAVACMPGAAALGGCAWPTCCAAAAAACSACLSCAAALGCRAVVAAFDLAKLCGLWDHPAGAAVQYVTHQVKTRLSKHRRSAKGPLSSSVSTEASCSSVSGSGSGSSRAWDSKLRTQQKQAAAGAAAAAAAAVGRGKGMSAAHGSAASLIGTAPYPPASEGGNDLSSASVSTSVSTAVSAAGSEIAAMTAGSNASSTADGA